jgi:branched-chain amino acid transport system permease protein
MSVSSRLGAWPLAGRSAWSRVVMILVFIVVAASVPQLGSLFYVSLASNFLIFGLLAMSLDLMAGYTGLVSLGHAATLGIGAYGIAVGMSRGLDANASIALALAASVAVAAAFGMLAVRVGGITFVMLTLALGQIVWGLAYRWVAISGGDNGLPVGGRPSIGPIDLSESGAYYYFVLAVFVVCAVLMWALVRSPFGLSLRGIQNNEQRMKTLGYNVWLHKYLVFVIAGFFGGVAGILFAFYNNYVSPTAIDFAHNGTVVQMVVVGGLGTLWGPVVGAILIVLMQQYVSIYVTRWVTVLGIIFVLTVLFAREGAWGLLLRLLRWRATMAGAVPPGPANVPVSAGLEELEVSEASR